MNSAYFHRLARYNAWANHRLYDACAQLSVDDYRAKRASFFGSIHATLNHILVGDRVWLSRFQNRPHDIKRLDQILYDDLVSLRTAREAEDARRRGAERQPALSNHGRRPAGNAVGLVAGALLQSSDPSS